MVESYGHVMPKQFFARGRDIEFEICEKRVGETVSESREIADGKCSTVNTLKACSHNFAEMEEEPPMAPARSVAVHTSRPLLTSQRRRLQRRKGLNCRGTQ
jgi:hypothetical protein